jgi:hypothetical protein
MVLVFVTLKRGPTIDQTGSGTPAMLRLFEGTWLFASAGMKTTIIIMAHRIEPTFAHQNAWVYLPD